MQIGLSQWCLVLDVISVPLVAPNGIGTHSLFPTVSTVLHGSYVCYVKDD